MWATRINGQHIFAVTADPHARMYDFWAFGDLADANWFSTKWHARTFAKAHRKIMKYRASSYRLLTAEELAVVLLAEP